MSSKQGRLTANGVILEKHEMRTVVFLLSRGYNIELIPKSNQHGVHTPDVKMLGLRWEIKCPKGEGKYLIQNTLHRTAHQSPNIILDLHRIKLHRNKCLPEIQKEFNKSKGIKTIKVITKTKEIIDFSR